MIHFLISDGDSRYVMLNQSCKSAMKIWIIHKETWVTAQAASNFKNGLKTTNVVSFPALRRLRVSTVSSQWTTRFQWTMNIEVPEEMVRPANDFAAAQIHRSPSIADESTNNSLQSHRECSAKTRLSDTLKRKLVSGNPLSSHDLRCLPTPMKRTHCTIRPIRAQHLMQRFHFNLKYQI